MAKREIIGRKLASMSNDDILVTWEALQGGIPEGFWAQENGISMDDWAEAVYSEKSERGL
ncbi:MAG: hypothetical protein HYY86_03325 [Candidatus Harrisonbacteria bacterium]|nr:hypothetical protein [Candidatus Harrisonbacteria bacterium]